MAELTQEPTGKGSRVEAYDDGGMQDYWVRGRSYWVSRSGVAYTWSSIVEVARSNQWKLALYGVS